METRRTIVSSFASLSMMGLVSQSSNRDLVVGLARRIIAGASTSDTRLRAAGNKLVCPRTPHHDAGSGSGRCGERRFDVAGEMMHADERLSATARAPSRRTGRSAAPDQPGPCRPDQSRSAQHAGYRCIPARAAVSPMCCRDAEFRHHAPHDEWRVSNALDRMRHGFGAPAVSSTIAAVRRGADTETQRLGRLQTAGSRGRVASVSASDGPSGRTPTPAW